MAKYKYIPCDIYKRGITVFIGSEKEFIAYCEKTYNDDDDERDFVYRLRKCSYGYADFHYFDGYGLVRLPSFPKTPMEIAAMTHELLHATFWLLCYSGVDFDSNGINNEAYTYLLEHLVRNTLEEIGYKDFTLEEEEERNNDVRE